MYIGSYSADTGEGIYSFAFDGTTGQFTAEQQPVFVANPSYLTLSRDGRYLYAVSETRDFQGTSGGGVAAYSIGSGGELTFLNSHPTLGFDPCYLSTDEGNSFLVAANYSGGSLTVFPLEENGTIAPHTSVVTHSESGPNRERQEMPHVHFTDFTPDGRYICAVDLGIDMVKFYRLNKAEGTLQEEKNLAITLRPGSGPRHVVFGKNGRFLYVVTELSCEVAVFEFVGGKYEPLQYVSTLPSGFQGENTAAALHISPDGRFLYASNRGHDSIAVYQISGDGLLKPCGIYSVQGRGPRDFAIEPHGNYLLAANEKSNEVVVFQRNQSTGALIPAGVCAKLHSPTCIQFLQIHDK